MAMATRDDGWRAWLALRDGARRRAGRVSRPAARLRRSRGRLRRPASTRSNAPACAPRWRAAIRAFDDWAAVDAQLERLARSGAALVTWNDASYPANLRADPRPAAVPLRARRAAAARRHGGGDRRLAQRQRVRPAHDARAGARAWSRYGVTVVSGLARGTDAAAHWTTLRAGGRTIAVHGIGD